MDAADSAVTSVAGQDQTSAVGRDQTFAVDHPEAAFAADRPTISAETSGQTLEVASADAVASDRVVGPLDPQDGAVQDLMDLEAGMDLWMDLHPHGCKGQVSFLCLIIMYNWSLQTFYLSRL